MLNLNDKNFSGPKVGGQKRLKSGCKSTLSTIGFLLIVVSIIALGHGTVGADVLDKVLDWTFYPNEAITYSDPSLFTISGGGVHLSTVDQSDNVTNSLKGLGFKKGTATFNSIWDTTQQWLTVAQPITLPDGSVAQSASAWTDMQGNVLLLHFDASPILSFPTVTFGNASTPVALLSNVDSSITASTATCMDVPPPAPTYPQGIYCPTHIPNVRVGGVMRFDGQDDELIMPNPVPAGTSTVTLEAWVFPTIGQYGAIISQGSTGGVPNYEIGVQPITSGMAVVFKMANLASFSGGFIPYNKWSHIVGTYNGSMMVLYVNGIQVGSKSASGVVVNSTQELVVGTSWINSTKGTSKAANTSAFGGMIDEVAVYTKVLLQPDVAAHYTHQTPIALPDGTQQSIPFSGVFDSRMLTVGSPVSWTTLSWVPAAPYGVQLPDNNGSETGYSMGNNTNMSGNVLLLHLNEPFGATNFLDTASGQPNNGSCGGLVYGVATTCPTMGQSGKFDKAVLFNGINDAITVPLPQGQSPTKAITLETWAYPTSNLIDSNVSLGLINKGSQNGSTNIAPDFDLGLVALTTNVGPGGPKNSLNAYFSLSGHTYVDPMPVPNWPNQTKSYIYGSNIPVGSWSHIVATYDGTTMKLYLNGVLQMSQIVSGGDVANSNNPVLIGMRSATLSYAGCAPVGTCYRSTHFIGKMDETAIYNRALTPTEVTAHYVRGVVKSKLQIRFCKQADCSDMPFFVGPDLTSGTYFTAPAIPTVPQTMTQKVDLTTLGIPKASTFQYRALFESPYTALFPAVSSVSIDPLHFPTTNPTVTVNTQKAFSQIISFDDVVVTAGGVNGSQGEVWYQFSPDNKSWYFCSGASWFNVANAPVDTNDISQLTSPKAQIKSCLSDTPFGADKGSGTMWYKAFFHSPNGVESIDLNDIKIGYKTPVDAPLPQPPPITTFALGATITQSVAEGASLDFKLDASGVDVTTPYKKLSCEGCPSSLKITASDNAQSVDVSYSPAYGEAGSYAGTISILGANDKTATQAVKIEVAHADAVPKITSVLGNKSVTAEQQVSFVFSATIANGHPLTYSIVNPQVGMAMGADGLFTWTPNKAGSYAVTLRASDNTVTPNLSSDQSLTITVGAVDAPPPPVAQSFVLNVNEGSELKFNLKKPDVSKTYTFACLSGCQPGLSLDSNTGAVAWTPTYSQAGSYDLQFQISGPDGPTLQPLQIVVKDTDATPQIANPGDKVVDAGKTVSFSLSAKDADGGTPHFEIASPKQDGMTLDVSSGSFSWVTKPEQAGSYIVVFHALDNQNPNLYSEQSVVVTVNKSESVAVAGGTLPQPESAPATQAPAAPTQTTTEAQPSTPAAATGSSSGGCSLIR